MSEKEKGERPKIDFQKIFLDSLENCGAPLTRVGCVQNVAMARGDELRGIAYFVPGKGQYQTERDARRNMSEKDRLYEFTVRRVE